MLVKCVTFVFISDASRVGVLPGEVLKLPSDNGGIIIIKS